VPTPNVQYATLEGTVLRDDPAAPGDTTKDQVVAGAMVTVSRVPAVTANADGTYLVPDLPLDATGRTITVFDPNTGRRGYFTMPTLVAGSNHFTLRLRSTEPAGLATARVRLYGPQNESVSGYRVIWPGFPPDEFAPKGSGVYELADVRVPQTINVAAVPSNANGAYGEQVAFGSLRVDFHGQIGVSDLRLPGSGTVIVRLEMEGSSAQVIGPVSLTYGVWDEAEQSMIGKTIEGTPDPNSGLVTFTKVPARQSFSVATVRNPAGFAAANGQLAYDGDVRNITLRLQTIGDVSGRVFAYDGVTPLSGATVRIFTRNATYAPAITNPDGSFRFAGIPAATGFTLVADLDRDGIYRTGLAGGATPQGGGPVANIVIQMRQQSTVEGQVLDTGNAIVPLARFWLRELAWPYRSIGTPQEPLQADINGRFVVSNVFTGEFRITAVHPTNQDIRGDYQGYLAEEGDATQRNIQVRVGGAGVGSISVTVTDPLLGFAPAANAEVALYRGGGRFDFATTNENGVVFFDGVPVGAYTVGAYSKSVGRGGGTGTFTVSNQQTTSVTVQLEFRGLVSGTLTDPESEPSPDAAVKGTPVYLQSPSSSQAASTDILGAFEFLGVPEGGFNLTAFEIGTNRRAVGPSNLFISRLVPEQKNIHLELERTGTLTVKTYLPNDTGGAGELAPLTEVTVWQGNLQYGSPVYYRGQQGNPVTFRKLLRGYDYGIEVRELGGEGRVVRSGGRFGSNVFAQEQSLVLPTSGTVEVRVVDAAGQPVSDARVDLFASFGTRTLYTPASGIVTLPGVPFGWVTAQASKGNVTASGGGSLASRSQTLVIPLNLGTNATVEGGVDAELGFGQPSVNTRVLMTVSTHLLQAPLRLETLTDATGAYRFTGIPVGGTSLALTFYGPDDTTIGATRSVAVADGTTGVIAVPRVKIDATPPRVLSIDPPANGTSVSPSTVVTITFSEQIASAYLNRNWFTLLATDDGSFVNSTIEPTVRPDGTFIVKIVPPPPPAGQKFPLKSNVLYRLAIPAGIRDTTGNAMPVSVGSSFTTVNYTEPAVVRVDPAEDLPIAANTTFRIKFNKPIDITSFDAGGGVLTLERLDAYKGNAIASVPIAKYLDPLDVSTLVVAPQGVAIAESSFYRLTVSGARDTQTPPNVQKDPRVAEYASFDTRKPVAKIVSPLAEGESLVSELLYTATVSVKDEVTNAESNDVAYVDWLDAAGVAIARVKTKPYSYSFVAPSTATGTTFTLKASAVDLSGNVSPSPDTFTWNVAPNLAPRDIVVTNTPSAAYPTHAVQTRVRLKDEGLTVNVALELRGTKTDGTEYRQVLGSTNLGRASTSVEFGEAVFNYTLADTLKDGTATAVVTATDSVNKTATAEAPLTILADTTKPEIVSFTPKAETHYQFNQTYTIQLQAKDAETGIARAAISVNGVEVLSSTSGSHDAGTGITTFTKSILVPPKNADTRVAIVVTAFDRRNNSISETHEVIYDRRDDSTLPKAAWLTPLDGAALPANQPSWLATLRVRATDDSKVTSVRFESSALASPITLENPKSGTTDIFEATTALAIPAGNAPFVIKAIVADGDPAHDVELPITIDPVDVAPPVTADINISSITADQYVNKSVFVRGARVYISVPLALKDLILVDGATLSNPEETKLDVTVADHLFVDARSRVDVSGRGYLGGYRTREDNSFTNTSLAGRTLGGTTNGGALNAEGSHAGLGGSWTGRTNATYGSITNPADFGSGGTAPAPNQPGGNGGGAVALRGGAGLARFVLAGPVAANGDVSYSAGAGGSILLDARAIITGPLTRITANGADSGSSDSFDAGGGGGRIAVRASERLDLDPALPVIQAHGGRNSFFGTPGEGPSYVDGGAGTIHLVRPGATLGELIVSSFDERYPSTTHRSAGTPLGGALSFDAITIGPRALARFDVASSAAMTVDPSATVVTPADVPSISVTSTTPAAGGDVAQNTAVSAQFNAASASGIREVRAILSAQPNDVVSNPKWPLSVNGGAITIAIPSNATPGTATLKLRVSDRAGRVAETAPLSFNIINNAAPAIQTFDVTPAQLYANHSISVSATASDDIAVNSLTLTSSAGTVTAGTATKPTPATMARTFTVAIPANAASNSDVTLTLSAIDDMPGRVPTTATKSVRILKDTSAPSITIAKPAPSQQFEEGSGATFTVEVNAADAEVAVSRVTVTFEGTEYDMALVSGTLYRKVLSVPNVDGSEPVAKTLTIKATDYDANTASNDVTISIKPLIDPNAPLLSWSCASPGAMYPAGYEAVLRAFAVPSSGSNGVSSVSFTIDGAPAPITGTLVGTDLYEAKYTIPPQTADGALLNVRVAARSVSGNEATLLGTILAVANAIDISTQSTVGPLDSGYQNRSVVVRSGGELTLTGEQHLRNLVVLSGGKLVQKHPDLDHAATISVDRLFVACGGTVDVSALGYPRVTSYPGAGVPDDASGGSHMGRGGHQARVAGLGFGSVYEPMQAGGGAHVYESGEGAGGGIVRILATSTVAIDGAVRANGAGTSFGGAGAGGSIWITSRGHFAGSGSFDASGGSAYYAGGGGGAIAFDYASTSGTPVVTARGGTASGTGRHGGAGTILRRAAGKNGDLVIDNGSITLVSHTQLPSFGLATAGSVANGTITLSDRRWISPALVGNRVRVTASDGTVRGVYRIAGVTNPLSYAQNFFYELYTTDSAAYDGYLVWSKDGIGAEKRPFAAVRKNGAQWQYDNDSAFVSFTPSATDFAFATFSKTASGISRIDLLHCAAACGSVDGLPVAEVVQGEVAPDVYSWRHPRGFDSGLKDANPSEIFLHTDGQRNGFVVSAGLTSVTLESLDGGVVSVQAGDTLRGVYSFDSLKITNGAVWSHDPIESATTPQILGTSWLEPGNVGKPAVNPAAITIQRGLRGPVLVGAAGAATDVDQPLEIVSRNLNGTQQPQQPVVLRNSNYAGWGNAGGFSIYHIDNNIIGSAGASAMVPITGNGYVAFMPSLVRDVQVGLAPADTTINYGEPGHNSFRLKANGTYEVWVNGAYANKSGSFTINTAFRIEKRGTSSLRYYVDNALVHEVTTGVAASLLLDVSFELVANHEIASVEYVTDGLPRDLFHAKAASDGSFRVPTLGNPGDAIAVKARDSMFQRSLESPEVVIGTLPNDIGLASVAFASNEITGGRTTVATVTLLAAAGSEGALVELASSSAAASVPASITIPSGATSGTFSVTTTAVAAQTDVTITATYGLAAASGALRIVKDNIAPAVTVTSPAANAQYTEGQTAKIAVQVTATDADSGVKRVFATLDGNTYDLARDAAKGADVYTAQIPVPYVDGSQPVTRNLVVSAEDNSGNIGASSAVPLLINAVVDPNPPSIAMSCGNSAIYPAGYIARLRAIAKAPNATNALHKVELIVTDASGAATTYTATSLGDDVFEVAYTVPDAADGSVFTTRFLATTASATTAQANGTLTILKGAVEIKSNTTIASGDTSKDNKNLVVFDGVTLTVLGAHTFGRVAVLPSASIAGASQQVLTFTASNIFVACGAAIDASGQGYVSRGSYPGVPQVSGSQGAGHIGRGGGQGGDHQIYGSVAQPREFGSAGT
ncbi:MAG TPA: Ig-like domain-containing protein, partial [Vicinamibacterales bacterium]